MFYKCFAYLVLGRIENTLDEHQPEEQHGFRSGRRVDEHLVSANQVIDKTLSMNTPVWIISLNLSKAFDRVDWPTLWQALRAHGVCEHLDWILQILYANQCGQVMGTCDFSENFPSAGGVRQGCVLSPRLFCAVLEWAMRDWRHGMQEQGLTLNDGWGPLLDLRFADDIVIFGTTQHGVLQMLDSLVVSLERVGLKLNASKTVALTTEAQPSNSLVTARGAQIKVAGSHKWLGCILATRGSQQSRLDVEHRLQSAMRAFYVSKSLLRDKNISIQQRRGISILS